MIPWEADRLLSELNMIQIASQYMKGHGLIEEHEKAKARIYELREQINKLMSDSGYGVRNTYHDLPKFDTFGNMVRVWQYYFTKEA